MEIISLETRRTHTSFDAINDTVHIDHLVLNQKNTKLNFFFKTLFQTKS